MKIKISPTTDKLWPDACHNAFKSQLTALKKLEQTRISFEATDQLLQRRNNGGVLSQSSSRDFACDKPSLLLLLVFPFSLWRRQSSPPLLPRHRGYPSARRCHLTLDALLSSGVAASATFKNLRFYSGCSVHVLRIQRATVCVQSVHPGPATPEDASNIFDPGSSAVELSLRSLVVGSKFDGEWERRRGIWSL